MADDTTPDEQESPEVTPEAPADVPADDAPVADETVAEAAVEATPEVIAEAPADEAPEAVIEDEPEAPAEPTEDELAAIEDRRAAEALAAEILAQAAGGDRDAVARLDEEQLRELAREKAAKPGATLRYIATGKRKTSVARVILTAGDGTFTINGRSLDDYFPRYRDREHILEPLRLIGAEEAYNVQARMHGGGITGQAGALRHGLSRALAEVHPSVRRQIKSRGFLKLDTRQVERKKAGLKKARKRPQFSKR